jgi:hypothetical protein
MQRRPNLGAQPPARCSHHQTSSLALVHPTHLTYAVPSLYATSSPPPLRPTTPAP